MNPDDETKRATPTSTIQKPNDGSLESPPAAGEVHEVIFSKVKPGEHERYSQWAERMREAQRESAGYIGSLLQPPDDPDGFWTTIIRFDSSANLEQWMRSSRRYTLLQEAKSFVEVEHLSKVKSSFPGWFPTDPVTGQGPPNWKAALLVLLGLFPIVMLEMKYLSPLLTAFGLHASVATFLGNMLSVALTSFVTMPICVRLFDWWLFPKRRPGTITAFGIALLIVLFAAEIVLLWHLLPW